MSDCDVKKDYENVQDYIFEQKEMPTDGGVSDYTLPVATEVILGGVKSDSTSGEFVVDGEGKVALNLTTTTTTQPHDTTTDYFLSGVKSRVQDLLTECTLKLNELKYNETVTGNRLTSVETTSGEIFTYLTNNVPLLQTAIDTIQTDITNIEANLNDAESDITSLSNELNQFLTDVEVLNASIIKNTNDITDIKNELDNIEGGSGGGVSSHNELTDRNLANQHEMSAITGLLEQLEQITNIITDAQQQLYFGNVSTVIMEDGPENTSTTAQYYDVPLSETIDKFDYLIIDLDFGKSNPRVASHIVPTVNLIELVLNGTNSDAMSFPFGYGASTSLALIMSDSTLNNLYMRLAACKVVKITGVKTEATNTGGEAIAQTTDDITYSSALTNNESVVLTEVLENLNTSIVNQPNSFKELSDNLIDFSNEEPKIPFINQEGNLESINMRNNTNKNLYSQRMYVNEDYDFPCESSAYYTIKRRLTFPYYTPDTEFSKYEESYFITMDETNFYYDYVLNLDFSNVWLNYPLTVDVVFFSGSDYIEMKTDTYTVDSNKRITLKNSFLENLPNGYLVGLTMSIEDSSGNFGDGSWANVKVLSGSNFGISVEGEENNRYTLPPSLLKGNYCSILKTDVNTLPSGDPDTDSWGLVTFTSGSFETNNSEALAFNSAGNAITFHITEQMVYEITFNITLTKTGSPIGNGEVVGCFFIKGEDTGTIVPLEPRVVTISGESTTSFSFTKVVHFETLDTYNLQVYWLDIGSGSVSTAERSFNFSNGTDSILTPMLNSLTIRELPNYIF